jgi:hypothetical protein
MKLLELKQLVLGLLAIRTIYFIDFYNVVIYSALRAGPPATRGLFGAPSWISH